MIFRQRRFPAPTVEQVELIREVGIEQAAKEMALPASRIRRVVKTWACRKITLQQIEAWYNKRTEVKITKLPPTGWEKL